MNEIAIAAILRYIDGYLFEPSWNWPRQYFNRRCYERWAASEIIDRLSDHPFDDPEQTVERFYLEMAYYSSFKEESEQNVMFAIAKETAMDILQYLAGEIQEDI